MGEAHSQIVVEIAGVLLRNVVQAVKLDEPVRGPSEYERFRKSARTMSTQPNPKLYATPELRITEHTEMGSNESIKNPLTMESSRSARKRVR